MSAREKNPEKDKNRIYKETGGSNNTVKETFSGTNDSTKTSSKSKYIGNTEKNKTDKTNYSNNPRKQKQLEAIGKKEEKSTTFEDTVKKDVVAENNARATRVGVKKSVTSKIKEYENKADKEKERMESLADVTYTSSVVSNKDKRNKSVENISNNIQGNVDVTTTPKDKDGKSIPSYYMETKEYGSILIPRVVNIDGKDVELTEDEAYERFNTTGEYFGQFKNEKEADDYLSSMRGYIKEYEDNSANYGTAVKNMQYRYVDKARQEGASEGQIAYMNWQQTKATNEQLKADGYSDEEIEYIWKEQLEPLGYVYTTASDVKKSWSPSDSEALTYQRSMVKDATNVETQAEKIRETLNNLDLSNVKSNLAVDVATIGNNTLSEDRKETLKDIVYNDDFWNYAIALANSKSYHTAEQQKDTQKIIDVLTNLGATYLNDADWEKLEKETGMSHDAVNKIYNVLTTREWGGKQLALGMLTSLPFTEKIIDENEKDEFGVSFNTVDYLNGMYDIGTGYTTDENTGGVLVSDESYKAIARERGDIQFATKGGNAIGTTLQMIAGGIGAGKIAGAVTSKIVGALINAEKISAETASIMSSVMSKAISSTILNTYMTASNATKKGYELDNFGMDWLKGELSFLAMTYTSSAVNGAMNKAISATKNTAAETAESAKILNVALENANRLATYDKMNNLAINTMKTAVSSAVGATAGTVSPIFLMDDEEKQALADNFGESWMEMFALSFGMEMAGTFAKGIKGRAEYKKAMSSIQKLIELKAIDMEIKTVPNAEELFGTNINITNEAQRIAYNDLMKSLTSLFNDPETSSMLTKSQKEFIKNFNGHIIECQNILLYNMQIDEMAKEKVDSMLKETEDLYPTNEATKNLVELKDSSDITNEQIELVSLKTKESRAIQEEAEAYLRGEITEWDTLSEATRKALSDARNMKFWAEKFGYDTDLSFDINDSKTSAKSNARARQVAKRINAMNVNETQRFARKATRSIKDGNVSYEDNHYKLETNKLDDGKIEATVTNKKLNISKKWTADSVESAINEAQKFYDTTSIKKNVASAIEETGAYNDGNIHAQIIKTKDGYKLSVDDISAEKKFAPYEKTVSTFEEAVDIITDYSVFANPLSYDVSMPLSQTAKELAENKMYKGYKITATVKNSKKNGTYLEVYDAVTNETFKIENFRDMNEAAEMLESAISERTTAKDVAKSILSGEEYASVKDSLERYENTDANTVQEPVTDKRQLRNNVDKELTNVLNRIKDGTVDAGDIGAYQDAINKLNEYDAEMLNKKAIKAQAKERVKLEKKISRAERKVEIQKEKLRLEKNLEKQTKIRRAVYEKIEKEATKVKNERINKLKETAKNIQKLSKLTDKSQYVALRDKITEDIFTKIRKPTEAQKSKAELIKAYLDDVAENNPNVNVIDSVYEEAKNILSNKKSLNDLDPTQLSIVNNAVDSAVFLDKNARSTIAKERKSTVNALAEKALIDIEKAKTFSVNINGKSMHILDTIYGKTLRPNDVAMIVDGGNLDGNGAFSKAFEAMRRSASKGNDFKYYELVELIQGLKENKLLKSLTSKDKYFDTGIECEVLTKEGKPVLDADGNPVKTTLKMSRSQLIFNCMAMKDSYLVDMMLGKPKVKNVYIDKNGEITKIKEDAVVTEKIVERDSPGWYNIPEEADWAKGKYREAYRNGQNVKLTESSLNKLPELLTEAERAFVDVARNIYDTCGNSMDMNMLEYNGRTVTTGNNNYVHAVGDGSFATTIENGKNKTVNASSTSVMQTRTGKGGYNPDSIVRNLLTVINDASYMYSAKSIDTYNALVSNPEVAKAVGTKFGNSFYNSLVNIGQDAKIQIIESNLSDKILSKYANAVTAINIGTTLKQIPSYFQLLSHFDAKSVLKGMFKNPDSEIVTKYSSTYKERLMKKGIVTTGSLNESDMQIINSKINLTSFSDLWTVKKAWGVAEEYVKSHYNTSGMTEEAFYKQVAEVYDKAVQETQPSRNKLDKAELLRSKNAVTKALMLFTSQPMQNWSLINEGFIKKANLKISGIENYKQTKQWKSATKQQLGTALGQALSAFTLGAITLGNAALRGSIDDLKDENGNFVLLPTFDENTGKLKSKGIVGEWLYDSFASAISSIPFAAKVFSAANVATGEYSSDAFNMPQFDMLNNVVDGITTIYNGITDNNSAKINRGLKDLTIGLSVFAGVSSEYVFKVSTNLLCEANPAFNAWYQNTFYGTKTNEVVDNPEALKYVFSGYNKGLEGTTAGKDIERIVLNDPEGNKIVKMLNGNNYAEDFNVGDYKIELENDERVWYGDKINEYYTKLANDFAESDGYVDLDDEDKANGYNWLLEYSKQMAKKDTLEYLKEKGKYKYTSASEIDMSEINLDDLEAEGIDISDYVTYRAFIRNMNPDGSPINDSAKKVFLSGLNISDESKRDIYLYEFDDDKMRSTMAKGDISATDYIRTKAMMSYYDNTENATSTKIDYINDSFDEKGKVAMYENVFETKSTKYDNKISTAVEYGISATSFLNRESQIKSIKGDKYVEETTSVKNRNGKIEKQTTSAVKEESTTKEKKLSLLNSGYTDEEITYFYQKEYNDDKFAVATAIGLNPKSYIEYKLTSAEFEGKVKYKKEAYINSMDISNSQKLILKMLDDKSYVWSTNEYQQIINYVIGLNISKEEKFIVFDTIGLTRKGNIVYPTRKDIE